MRTDFSRLESRAAGLFLWGSHATGHATARSDIDVCVVAGEGTDPVEVLIDALAEGTRAAKRYDVRLFEELPLFLKGAVLDHGLLVFARDGPGLHEYVRRWRVLWEEQKFRMRRTQREAAADAALPRRGLAQGGA